jgi:hypothetical protein
MRALSLLVNVGSQDDALPDADRSVDVALGPVEVPQGHVGFNRVRVDLHGFGKFFYGMVMIVGKDILDAFKKSLVPVSREPFRSGAFNVFCQAPDNEAEGETERYAQEDFKG